MMSPGIMAKKRHGGGGGGGGFTLGCGCKDAKAVSVSVSVSPSTETSTTTATRCRARANPSTSTTDTLTLPSASSSSYWEEAGEEPDDDVYKPESSASTPSFSGLLRQLNELEQSVVSWGRKSQYSKSPFPQSHNNDFSPLPPPPQRPLPLPQQHRMVKSDDDNNNGKGGGGSGRLEESVAVVKESENPLVDFRRSMLQMIVEKEIVAGEELRELLRRFLALNAPQHHDVILRAFAEIWDEVFAATAAGHVEPARLPRLRAPPRRRRTAPAWRV